MTLLRERCKNHSMTSPTQQLAVLRQRLVVTRSVGEVLLQLGLIPSEAEALLQLVLTRSGVEALLQRVLIHSEVEAHLQLVLIHSEVIRSEVNPAVPG
jgi:hypothetical protein